MRKNIEFDLIFGSASKTEQKKNIEFDLIFGSASKRTKKKEKIFHDETKNEPSKQRKESFMMRPHHQKTSLKESFIRRTSHEKHENNKENDHHKSK